MKYLAVVLSALSLVSARLEVLSPLDPASDAPEGWLQVCCQDNDKNDDGAISFREFTPFVLEILELDRKALGEIFLAGDLDRNSDLDGNECPIIRAQIRDRMRKKVQEALATFDSDKDSRLSKEEVQRLALRQFKLMAPEADQVFSEFHGPISGDNVTKLLLELRSRQIQKFGGKLVNLHLSKVKYFALLGELESSRVDTAPIRRKRAYDGRNSDYDQETSRNARSSNRDFLKDVDYFGDGEHHIFPRAETAPPPEEVAHVKISDSGEIDKEFAARISSRSMMGGGRAPAELQLVTIKYDDPDFQRWRSL